ncbi:unnamed protein product [Lactuca virosa]|uniref:Uncharacterized protein n=1 Tax=Lactuca virosa TaxID=75947 RepID=A0AAU9PV19_9ASTR|nr:unnamed protein product [Lactuca virosa]
MPGRMVKLVTLAPDFSSFLLPFPPSPPFCPSSAPQTRPPLVRSICCLHLRRTVAAAGRRSRRRRRTRSRRRRRTHPLVRQRRSCVRRPSFSVFPTGSPGRRLHLPSPSRRHICPPNLTASLLDFFPKIDVLLLTTTQSMFEVQLNASMLHGFFVRGIIEYNFRIIRVLPLAREFLQLLLRAKLMFFYFEGLY